MDEESKPRVVILEGSIEDLIGGLLSRGLISVGRGRVVDFGSAHFLYDLASHLDVDRYNRLAAYGNALPGNFLNRPEAPFPDLPFLEDVLKGMVRSETSLQFSDKNFHGLMGVNTRFAMAHVLDKVARDDRKLAFPLPNWHFWALDYKGLKKPETVYFDARSETELVEGFESAVKYDGARALMLVNPANPLLFDLSDEGSRAIADTASRYGVDVIVDDVLRGTRPKGQRDSAGRFFEHPYVVEGLSKRFGDDPFGKFSYIITPPKRKINVSSANATNLLKASGGILQMALEDCTDHALDELAARNRLFDEGFGSTSCGVEVYRPFPSSLTSVLRLPADYPIDAKTFSDHAHFAGGIDIIPFDAFYPNGHIVPMDMQRLLRITIGRIDSCDMRDSASYLGSGFKIERDRNNG